MNYFWGYNKAPCGLAAGRNTTKRNLAHKSAQTFKYVIDVPLRRKKFDCDVMSQLFQAKVSKLKRICVFYQANFVTHDHQNNSPCDA